MHVGGVPATPPTDGLGFDLLCFQTVRRTVMHSGKPSPDPDRFFHIKWRRLKYDSSRLSQRFLHPGNASSAIPRTLPH